MSAPGYLQRLYAHLDWADNRALEALRGAAPPPPPPRAVELYAHILGAEHVWLARTLGEVPAHPVWPALDLAGCETLAAANRAGFGRLLAEMTPTEGERMVAYVNSAGDEFLSRVEDILLQVVLHGAYHRGQVALLLRDGGYQPIPTDFIAFVRGAPAATRRA